MHVKPLSVSADALRMACEPLSINVEPRSMVRESRSIKAEPLSMARESLSINTDVLDMARELLSMARELLSMNADALMFCGGREDRVSLSHEQSHMEAGGERSRNPRTELTAISRHTLFFIASLAFRKAKEAIKKLEALR